MAFNWLGFSPKTIHITHFLERLTLKITQGKVFSPIKSFWLYKNNLINSMRNYKNSQKNKIGGLTNP